MADEALAFGIESGTLTARNVKLRADTTVDELLVEIVGLRGSVQPDGDVRVTSKEAAVTAIISEVNLNRLMEASIPADAPVRSMRLAVLTGKIRLTGQVVKMGIGLPISADAVIRIEAGVRAMPDWQTMTAAGIGLPSAVVQFIENQLKSLLTLDLRDLPLPLWLSEAICEPGRIVLKGSARLNWPLEAQVTNGAARQEAAPSRV
ncbi:MAG: LmeA family phospholipid-binding protein [Armatimonadetes bacterium]|nr:LmeA family phospholipid-binding protein [Armatimonadota bacterium]MDE2205139.1 LmeA family phospholipid-binding protein [Armatimonadota bacterium]